MLFCLLSMYIDLWVLDCKSICYIRKYALFARVTRLVRSRLKVCFFGKIGKRIIDPRQLGSRCIRGTEKPFPRVDL